MSAQSAQSASRNASRIVIPSIPNWLLYAEEPENIIFENELQNAKKVLTTFTDTDSQFHMRWVVLLAFPQSGKTNTFLFVACEMLRLEKVERVTIICGNADLDLKTQLNENKDAFISYAYSAYLEDEIQYDRRTRDIFIKRAKLMISILVGADLDSSTHFDVRNTLIIWDEAHYAQDRINRPHKYLKSIGLTADGDVANLVGERNNYALTVSATPFSELSNIVHHNQNKRIVKMKPGPTYIGPRRFIEHGSLIQFDSQNRIGELINAMRNSQIEHQDVPKYCVARFIGDENVHECELAAADLGWDVKVFDSKSKTMRSMNELSVAPVRPTLVVIRGKCRMGKRVPKKHISFVFESSQWSATDVLLQGLFGRMLGYDGNVDIKVYISDKIKIEEVWKYVQMMEDTDDLQPVKVLPKSAKNLTTTKIHAWDDTIPIILRTDDDAAVENLFGNRTNIIQKVKYAFNQMVYCEGCEHGDDVIENYNDERVTGEIAKQISDAPLSRNENDFRVVIHNVVNDAGELNATYAEMPEKMRSSIQTRTPLNTGNLAGCGFASDDKDVVQVNLWMFNTHQFHQSHGFKFGDIVIHARIPHIKTLEEDVPITTTLETFATHDEDGTETRSNGGYSIRMPIETAYDVNAMKSSLADFIRLSQSPDFEIERPTCVTSNHDGISKFVGITLSHQVFESLQKGGDIYNDIKREFGVKLKTHKCKGKTPADFVHRGLTRITKIEWIKK